MKLRTRSIVTLAAAVTMAALLTACSPHAGKAAPAPTPTTSGAGISREAAAALLNAVPGLSGADIGSVISGLTIETRMEVSVEDDAAITAPGVLDYVLRVGWATAVGQKPSSLSLTVWKQGTRLDLQAQANLISGVDERAFPLLDSVYLDNPAYLGTWPGAVPALTAS